MDDNMIFETFAAEFDKFLELNPDLDETDGDAYEMLMFCLDLNPLQRWWLEDFCARFDAEMDKAIQGKNPGRFL